MDVFNLVCQTRVVNKDKVYYYYYFGYIIVEK